MYLKQHLKDKKISKEKYILTYFDIFIHNKLSNKQRNLQLYLRTTQDNKNKYDRITAG